MINEKQAYRKLLRLKRINLPKYYKRFANTKINSKLKSLVKRNHYIAVYDAMGSEADLSLFIDYAFKLKLKIYFPCFTKKNRRMYFYQKDNPKNKKRIENMQTIIVPLIGIDKNGYRLGQGGGYYDYSLSFSKKYQSINKIGIGFSCQIVDNLPHNEYDIKLDYFLCEDQLIKFK